MAVIIGAFWTVYAEGDYMGVFAQTFEMRNLGNQSFLYFLNLSYFKYDINMNLFDGGSMERLWINMYLSLVILYDIKMINFQTCFIL